jgi:S1-C subfamily serine protease
MTSETVKDIAAQCADAVARIATRFTRSSGAINPFYPDPFFREFFEDQPRTETGLGSGFLFRSNGYILTNNHVIEGADAVSVYLTSREEPYEATVIGRAAELDLAVIKIEGEDFPYLTFGDSEYACVGDWVVAIGNPYGLDHTVTVGVISAKGRPLTISGTVYQNLLQTDAAINRGNSGGPMLNLRGEVIGINTAINAAAQGIGFAIPSSTVMDVIDELESGVERIRPWIGVNMQPLTREMIQYFNIQDMESGVIVYSVIKFSPADKAGILRGDVLMEIDGTKVTDTAQVQGLIRSRRVGEIVNVRVNRDGEILDIAVMLEESKIQE